MLVNGRFTVLMGHPVHDIDTYIFFDQSHSFSDELNQFFANLTALTEFAYRSNGNTPVVILTHSMGSVAAHHWLTRKVDQAWKDRYMLFILAVVHSKKSNLIVHCLPDTSVPSSPSPARGRGQ